MRDVYLLLGSNEGDRMGWLELARQELSQYCGSIMNISSVYETAAWGKEDQPSFLNMALELSTTLQPAGLLACTQAIEKRAGRDRAIKWGQRTLDIDLLFYGDHILSTTGLTIPHPYLHERRFTLQPLAEIAPAFIHPVLKQSIEFLNMHCADELAVKLFTHNSSSE